MKEKPVAQVRRSTCSRCVLYQGDGKCVILSDPFIAKR